MYISIRNFSQMSKMCLSCMYIDINTISWCLDLNIFQQDECFCSKLGLEVEHAMSKLKTPLSQIWVICHLLPFVRVGQNCCDITDCSRVPPDEQAPYNKLIKTLKIHSSWVLIGLSKFAPIFADRYLKSFSIYPTCTICIIAWGSSSFNEMTYFYADKG